MKKIITALAFTFALNASGHMVKIDKNYRPIFSKNAKALAENVRTHYLKVVPGELYFPNGVQRQKLDEALRVIEAVVNSSEFKEKVIAYVGTDGKRQYTSNNNLSNEEIYEKLMAGSELLSSDSLGEMNFDLTWYNRFWSKVIAHTSPGRSNWINVNWKFYKNFDVEDMASNVLHEWIHLMGFYHDSARDHDSVPYAVGYIMGDLAKKYQAQGYLN